MKFSVAGICIKKFCYEAIYESVDNEYSHKILELSL